jgi:hypothetical protein
MWPAVNSCSSAAPPREKQNIQPKEGDMKGRTRIAAIAAVLLAPPLGMVVWYEATKASASDDGLNGVLEKLGYYEVTPPSRLYGPGTIITVEERSDGALNLHLACKINEDALAGLWQRSMTLDQSVVTNIERQFDSEAKATSAITAHANGRSIRDVNISLLDVSILTMSDEDLLDVRRQYMVDRCRETIIFNLDQKARVCQTVEVLQADVVQTFKFDDGLKSDEKLGLTEQSGGSVSIDDQVSHANEVRGNDLFLGVKVRFGACFEFGDDGELITVAGL